MEARWPRGTNDGSLETIDVERYCSRGYATRFEGGRNRTLVGLAKEAVVAIGGRAVEWGTGSRA